jgi:hypothetical protein
MSTAQQLTTYVTGFNRAALYYPGPYWYIPRRPVAGRPRTGLPKSTNKQQQRRREPEVWFDTGARDLKAGR